MELVSGCECSKITYDEGETYKPGESGEIVVTHLCTNDFPFVRYRTGDVGALASEACDCGRHLGPPEHGSGFPGEWASVHMWTTGYPDRQR